MDSGPPQVGGCGSDVGGGPWAFCASFVASVRWVQSSVSILRFWKTKLHINKRELSVLMKLFPNTSVVLGQNWRFQCKQYSQADCPSISSGCPPMGASGVLWVRRIVSPHPSTATSCPAGGGRSQLSGLLTPPCQGPSPFTSSPA